MCYIIVFLSIAMFALDKITIVSLPWFKSMFALDKNTRVSLSGFSM